MFYISQLTTWHGSPSLKIFGFKLVSDSHCHAGQALAGYLPACSPTWQTNCLAINNNYLQSESFKTYLSISNIMLITSDKKRKTLVYIMYHLMNFTEELTSM